MYLKTENIYLKICVEVRVSEKKKYMKIHVMLFKN